jgi:hypothetical protein
LFSYYGSFRKASSASAGFELFARSAPGDARDEEDTHFGGWCRWRLWPSECTARVDNRLWPLLIIFFGPDVQKRIAARLHEGAGHEFDTRESHADTRTIPVNGGIDQSALSRMIVGNRETRRGGQGRRQEKKSSGGWR